MGDSRMKDHAWGIKDSADNVCWHIPAGGPILAVLMDIRDELKDLNRILHCQNFLEIPHTLRGIRKKLPAPKPRRKVRR